MTVTNIKPKKSLGQHFLKSKETINRIVDVSGIFPGDVVVEVGPCTGALTEALLSAGAHVIAIEKDARCVAELNMRFDDAIEDHHLILLEGDMLDKKIEHELFGGILSGIPPYKVVANIPYYITGLLLRHFLERGHQPTQITFLVQEEVAQSIGGKHQKESILSLSVKVFGDPHYAGHVGREHFDPPPKVDSAILVIKNINRERLCGVSEEQFFATVKAGFRAKRKMLIGNLVEGLVINKVQLQEIFSELNLDLKVRAEDVSLEKWVELAQKITHL